MSSNTNPRGAVSCCRTSKIIDFFSKCLCLHPSPKKINAVVEDQPIARSKTPTNRAEILEFVEREQQIANERSERRSRMLCESFLQSHMRVPLRRRKISMATEPTSPLLHFAKNSTGAPDVPPKRSVSKWAQQRSQ